MSCRLNITAEEWSRIKHCEALILREYEFKGTHFAHAVAWGDLAEMEDQVSTPTLCIIPTGVKFICQIVLPVKDISLEEDNALRDADAQVPEPKLGQDIREGS